MSETLEEKRERLAAYQRAYRKKHREAISAKERLWYSQLTPEEKQDRAEKAHEYHLKRNFNLSKEQYEELLERQNQSCAICDKICTKGVRLAVDHDHKTLEIRGLLCSLCNHRVVGRHRRGGILQRAVAYLEGEYTGWFAPEKTKKRRSRRGK